jgi:hypothetical protein
VWYVPKAVGRPVITWHARRWDDEKRLLNARSPEELAAAIESEDG